MELAPRASRPEGLRRMTEPEDCEGEPLGHDGPASEGWHMCTPYNGGHNWTSPYRLRMDWVIRCNKCCEVRPSWINK